MIDELRVEDTSKEIAETTLAGVKVHNTFCSTQGREPMARCPCRSLARPMLCVPGFLAEDTLVMKNRINVPNCSRPLQRRPWRAAVWLETAGMLALWPSLAIAQAQPSQGPTAPQQPRAQSAQVAPPPRPKSLAYPVCTQEENRALVGAAQRMDDDFVYGAGESSTLQAAYDLAIADAMKTLEIKLRGEDSISESEGRHNGVSQTDLRIQQNVRVQIDQRRAGCMRLSACLGPNDNVRVRASCPRYSEMEQKLRKAAERLAAALPASATVMVLPPTDEGDTYTQLGYQAQGILQQRLQPPLLQPSQKLFIPGKSLSEDAKKPLNLTKLWRERHVTHVVVGETSVLSGSQVEFRLHLQLISTEEVLPQSLSSFDLTLDPQEQEKLAIKGAVFSHKPALDLAGTTGDKGGAEVRLSATKLREGENVEISFRIAEPAYVYVFDIYENGKASLLIPGSALPNNHFEAGRWYTFPDDEWKKAGYVLKACPIPGDKINRERIKVIATSKPINLQLDRYTLNDLADLKEGPRGQIAELYREIVALQRSGASVATATTAYDITAVAKRDTGCPKE
jgi:hypothetical protein